MLDKIKLQTKISNWQTFTIREGERRKKEEGGLLEG